MRLSWRQGLIWTLGLTALLGLGELALRARYRQRVLPAGPAQPDTVTVVALGDSIVLGWPGAPAAAWPAWLAARLRAEFPAVGWQVVNAGARGETAALGSARYDRDVAAAGPRLTLIAFGLNDCNPARHAMDRWYETRVPSGPATSYLWRAVQARIERLGTRLGWLSSPAPELTPLPFSRTSPAGFSAALAALADRTEDIGARPVLLTMTPLAETETVETRARRGSYDAYNERIRELAARRHWLLIDLSTGAPVDAFEPDGIHLTASGQRWVAGRVYETLADAGVWAALAEGPR